MPIPRPIRKVAVAILVALGGIVLLGLILVAALSGGDPTEDAFPVILVNDTQNSVTLSQCAEQCRGSYHTYRLVAGATQPVNATSENLDEYFSVTNSDGLRLGCLDLKFQTKQPYRHIAISSAGKCPGS